MHTLICIYEGAPPKTGNILWRADFPCYMSVLRIHLYWCTSWYCCQRLWEVSVHFLKESFSVFAVFMLGDLRAHLPTPCWVFSSFWLKIAWPPWPTLPIYMTSTWATFYLFPQMKKVLKGKRLSSVEEMKQKMEEVQKGIKISKFKNCFEQWKKVLIGILHQMESTLKVTIV